MGWAAFVHFWRIFARLAVTKLKLLEAGSFRDEQPWHTHTQRLIVRLSEISLGYCIEVSCGWFAGCTTCIHEPLRNLKSGLYVRRLSENGAADYGKMANWVGCFCQQEELKKASGSWVSRSVMPSHPITTTVASLLPV